MKLTYKKVENVECDIYLSKVEEQEYRLLSKILGNIFDNHVKFCKTNGFNLNQNKILDAFQNTISSLNYEITNLDEYTNKPDKLELLTYLGNDYKLINNIIYLIDLYMQEIKIDEFSLIINLNDKLDFVIIPKIFDIEE